MFYTIEINNLKKEIKKINPIYDSIKMNIFNKRNTRNTLKLQNILERKKI
jgi:hypothetical protein